MAEEPSSEAPSLPERLELEGEKPLPAPASPAAAAAATEAVAVAVEPPKSESTPSSPVTGASGSSPDPAVASPSSPEKGVEVEVSAPETLAVPAAAADNSNASSDGGGDDRGERRSSPQRLTGATAPALGNSSAAAPVVSVPLDAVRLPIIAVPCFIAPAALLEPSGLSSQFAMTHQAVLATVTAQAQMQLPAGHGSLPAASPISPAPAQEKPLAASDESILSPEGDREQPSAQKTESAQNAPMKASGDGFNWRKYGQKQVKGSESSRSYYKCTYASCSAKKKVEHRQDGHVLEVIYRGGHNHHPPQKGKFSKERRPLPGGPSGDHESSTPANGRPSRAGPPPLKADPSVDGDACAKRLHCSSDCEADADVKARGNPGEEPDLKRRLVERPKAAPSPVFKTAKEPKVIRQATSESGSLSDGYRWRKYGQKIVKGNPNPRSYYRCTQMGCPARKHVEKDSTDEKAVIVNYEGKHNHDLPPPKTGGGGGGGGHPPPAADLLVAAAAAIEAGDRAARPASPAGGGSGAADGSLESAQTLLSIGFGPAAEGDDGRGSWDGGAARPLFDKHRPGAAVSVQNS